MPSILNLPSGRAGRSLLIVTPAVTQTANDTAAADRREAQGAAQGNGTPGGLDDSGYLRRPSTAARQRG